MGWHGVLERGRRTRIVIVGHEIVVPSASGPQGPSATNTAKQPRRVPQKGQIFNFWTSRRATTMSRPRLTNVPNFKNAPLVGLAEGNGSFSNYVLASLVLGLPWLLKRVLPFINRGGFKTYLFLAAILGLPITVAYWTLMSMFGSRKNEKVVLPGKDIEEYINIKDPELRARYHGKEKIPIQTFHDAYFDGKIDFNGISLFVPPGIPFTAILF
jgi:hypothetical protein